MRIGIDMDGTLADLGIVWRHIERQLFGEDAVEADDPDDETSTDAGERDRRPATEADRRRREIWRAIRSIEDFWTHLPPIEDGLVGRLHELAVERKWEIFFLTQRPATAGESVQRQTQRWLVAQGFEYPSVLTVTGSRGAAAASLYLDVLIDDLPRNCLDVVAESRCRPLLVLAEPDEATALSARRVNVTVVPSVNRALDLLLTPESPALATRILQSARSFVEGRRRGGRP